MKQAVRVLFTKCHRSKQV